MERYLAVVENGVVSNLMVIDPEDAATIAHFGGVLVPANSPVQIGWTHDGAVFAAPVVVQPQLTQAEILAQYTKAIQKRLDDFARTRGYDGILSACTYATSAVPRFAAEGQYCVSARDATWAAAYTLLADVEAGTRTMPTLIEVIASLPDLVWPL